MANSPETPSNSENSLGYDPGQLEEEIKAIGFKESYATEFGSKELVFDGRLQRIHRTNEFTRNFGIYGRLRMSEEPQTVVEQAISRMAPERQLDSIFDRFEAECPNLYGKMREVAQAQVEAERQARSKLEMEEQPESPYGEKWRRTEQEFYASKAYSKMAEIARSINPDYKLGYLYK